MGHLRKGPEKANNTSGALPSWKIKNKVSWYRAKMAQIKDVQPNIKFAQHIFQNRYDMSATKFVTLSYKCLQ